MSGAWARAGRAAGEEPGVDDLAGRAAGEESGRG
jgi:hypothetical protein